MSTNTRRRPATPRNVGNNSGQSSAAHSPAHPALRAPKRGVISSTSGTSRSGPAGSPQRGQAQRSVSRHERFVRRRRMSLLLKVGGAVLAGVAVLALIYVMNTGGASAVKPGQAGQYRFAVASPATGALAPDFSLPSTAGGTVHLSDFRGKNVLLYFHEGIGCEGCWTQMKDIQAAMGDFNGLGIETMVTITTNPLGALRQKVADEGLTLPVLSDASFSVSRAYNATQYGMMAGSADGHTFILVGPDGRIRWRADYGGPPKYTMYVPVSNLIADIKAGTKASTHGN